MQHKSLKFKIKVISKFKGKTAINWFTIILKAIMHAFCFTTGKNRAKQNSSIVDWSWLNKNMKDRLLNCFVLTIFIVVNFTTGGLRELNRPVSG